MKYALEAKYTKATIRRQVVVRLLASVWHLYSPMVIAAADGANVTAKQQPAVMEPVIGERTLTTVYMLTLVQVCLDTVKIGKYVE